MEDNGKMILWGTLVVLLLMFYWNVTKFEVSESFTETEKFVTF